MAGLTAKNKQAIDLYLGADPTCKGNGTKSWQKVYGNKDDRVAQANWSRMLSKAIARDYLDSRQKEIQDAVKDEIAYGIEEAIRDLKLIQKDAMAGTFEDAEEEDEQPYELGMRDRKAAIQATVEMLKVQGKYVTKSESTSTQATPEDRQYAGLYGMSVTQYLERKAAGTLPPKPEVPGPAKVH